MPGPKGVVSTSTDRQLSPCQVSMPNPAYISSSEPASGHVGRKHELSFYFLLVPRHEKTFSRFSKPEVDCRQFQSHRALFWTFLLRIAIFVTICVFVCRSSSLLGLFCPSFSKPHHAHQGATNPCLPLSVICGFPRSFMHNAGRRSVFASTCFVFRSKIEMKCDAALL